MPVIDFGEDILRGKTREEFMEHLKSRIEEMQVAGLLEVWLFGSIVREKDFSPGLSDIDMVVVMETDAPWAERTLPFDRLYEEISRLDLLVYTPQEWAIFLQSGNGFWEKLREEKIRLL